MAKVQARSKTSFADVPEELKALPQWVVHKDKVPFNPLTGRRASANKPETWASYEDALKALETGKYSGLGFELNHNDLVGIDLDKCIDAETGELSARALEIVDSLDSYTEYSPSGLGLHIFVYGDISADGRKSDWIEMYKASRYLTISGDVFGDVKPIADRANEVQALYKRFFGDESAASEKLSFDESEDNWLYDSIITRACESANGELFKRLYAGDWSGYPSQSEADLALCNILAYWTGGDPAQIDGLFRMSGLMRDKWDEKRGNKTIGQTTIAKALKQKPMPKPDALKSLSAHDLQNTKLPPTRWFVSGLIPQGLTLIVAPPKAGKSWLVLDLCLSVSTGQPFLNRKTNKCACLYLALEDGYIRLQERMDKLLLGERAPDNLEYVLDVSKIDEGFQEQIEDYIRDHKDVGMIVVDTLQCIRPITNNRNVYAQDYTDLKTLWAIANKHNIALVVLHHTNKGRPESDPFLRIGGTNGLFGAVDTAIMFDRPDKGTGQTTIHATSRNADVPDLVVTFDKTFCRWMVIGSVEQVQEQKQRELYENDSLVMTIKDLLEDADHWEGTTQELYDSGFFQENVRAVGRRIRAITPLLLKYDGITYADRMLNGKTLNAFAKNTSTTPT